MKLCFNTRSQFAGFRKCRLQFPVWDLVVQVYYCEDETQWEDGAGLDTQTLMPVSSPNSLGSQGATYKYKVWMRHRYHSCCNRLEELLTHPSFQVKVSFEVLGPAFPLISKAAVGAFDLRISSLTCWRDSYLENFHCGPEDRSGNPSSGLCTCIVHCYIC